MTNHIEKIKTDLLSQRATLLERSEKIRANRQQKRGPLSAKSSEQAVELENDEVVTQLDDASRRQLKQIQAALTRIEQEDYGACVSCQGQIKPARLSALPWAIHCIRCASSTGAS